MLLKFIFEFPAKGLARPLNLFRGERLRISRPWTSRSRVGREDRFALLVDVQSLPFIRLELDSKHPTVLHTPAFSEMAVAMLPEKPRLQ